MKNNKLFGWLRNHGVFVLSLLLVAAISTFGQGSTGTILGTVKDATGATVAGATVTVTSVDTGAVRTGMTGEDGAYRFPELLVGRYEVTVMKDGFQIYDRKGITLEIAEEAVIDVALQVGSTGQTVTVTEEAPLVNTTGATLGGTVDEQKVEDLPLNGRNFVDLSLMQTGVTQTSIVTGPYGMGGTMYSSNGATLRSNQTTLDGAPMTTLMGLSSTSAIFTTMGIDGIKEYKVVTNMFSAEYGLATGSQTTIVSKGGSNQWHGDGFEYLRNSALDSRAFLDVVDAKNALNLPCDSQGNKLVAFPCKRIAPYHRSNFGGSFGGPIKKDKTFFYGVYEGLREHISPEGAPGTGTEAETFLLGCYVSPAGGNPTGVAIPGSSDVFATNGVLPNVIDNNPATNPFLTNINGTKYACTKPVNTSSVNNMVNIPLGNGDAVAQAQIRQLASNWSLPTPGLGGVSSLAALAAGGSQTLSQPFSNFNFVWPFSTPQTENYAQLRFDENINANDSAFLRWTTDKSSQYTNGDLPMWQNHNRSLSAIGTGSETHILTPTLLNTFRVSFARTDLTLEIPTFANAPASGVNPSYTGGPFPAGVLIPGRLDSTGITPGGLITADGTQNGNTIGDIAQNVWSVADDIFWTHGKHAFKFGTLLNHYTGLFRVTFQYEGTLAYPNEDQFLLGQYSGVTAPFIGGGITPPPAIGQLGGNSPQDREYWWNTLGFYLQDDYRILPRVTLNLGIRYEMMTLPNAPPGLSYSVLNPPVNTGNPISGPADGQGVAANLWSNNPSLHNFSPRVGFAWDVFGNGKTSIRGGGGIYYDIADVGTSIAGNATGDPSLSALETVAITYPANYITAGLPLLPLSIAGLQADYGAPSGSANCFTPTCPNFGYLSSGATPQPPPQGNAGKPPQFQGGGQATTISLTSRVADAYMQQPTMGEWNLTLDHQLPFGMGATVSYVGSKGWHVMQTTEGNPILPVGCTSVISQCGTTDPNGFLPNGLPFFCPLNTTTGQCTTGNTLDNRSNAALGGVMRYTAAGDSYYQSLQIAVNKRLNHGLQFQLSYSFSKSEDDGEKANSDGGSGALSGQTVGIIGPNATVTNLGVDKGLSFFDVNQNLRANVIYHIPNVKWDNFAGKALHGWWMGTIITSQTGFPINIWDGTDRSETSSTNASGARPDLCTPALCNGGSYNAGNVITGNPNQWIQLNQFAIGPGGQFGNAPRDAGAYRGPKLNNTDLSINKDTAVKWLGEGGAIQFRCEMFNIFNHLNYVAPAGTLGGFTGGTGSAMGGVPGVNSQFGSADGTSTNIPGTITTTTTKPRTIQLALKILF